MVKVFSSSCAIKIWEQRKIYKECGGQRKLQERQHLKMGRKWTALEVRETAWAKE